MSPHTFDEPIRLLLVDVNEGDRAAVRRYLIAAQVRFTIDERVDARDIVDRAAGEAYDCIMLDFDLPDETAFDVIRRLRAAEIWTPILCVAGQDEEVGAALVAAGASDFLSKSDLSPSRLSRRLRYVLRLGRAEGQARRVRAELDAQRLLVNVVIAQLPTGVIVTDPHAKKVLVSNTRAAAVVGHEAELFSSTTSPAMTRAREGLEAALRTAEVVRLEETVAHAGRELRISAAPVVGEERILAGMVVLDDVTEQVEARRAAERAARAREDVLAIVSHDLRGPLSAINVALDCMRDPELEAEGRGRYIAAIQRSVNRADRLIGDLVTAQQIEDGRLRIEPRVVAVRALLEQAAREHELMAAQGNAKLLVNVEDGVEKMTVDADRISQALANLIGNALRYARGTHAIELSASRGDGDEVVLAVRDYGPGVNDDALPHVFDRYWQGRERRGGSGLGLAIVRGIARAHGGDASVAHAPGGGALFAMRLPGG